VHFKLVDFFEHLSKKDEQRCFFLIALRPIGV
jgi:hypothetical protein